MKKKGKRKTKKSRPTQGSSKKMKENTKDTTDRISTLPDFIIHHILSYLLDDPKSRVRMSVLSKGWVALTASFPILYFHLKGAWVHSFSTKYDDFEYIREKFYKYVEHTVSRFCDQNISAHTLDISANALNLEQRELFGRCLELVLEKGLQVMDIHFDCYQPMFRLPNTLLSASSLTSLRLHKCELPSSLMVGVMKFKSLRLLSLSHLPIDEDVIQYLTKGCPLLEEIYLKYCYGFKAFCVKRHHNLLKVEIYCGKILLLERIDVEAPNLSYFLLVCNKDKAPSMFMASCKKLTTFCYSGPPFERQGEFLSNFTFIENLYLDHPSHVNNLKLSNHSLKKIRLQSRHCDLEEIDLNTPNLLLFEYCDHFYGGFIRPLSWKHSSLLNGCMIVKWVSRFSLDSLQFQKLRQFLEKNSIFKVLKFPVFWEKLIDVEELKLIESPPYELEHVELSHLDNIRAPILIASVDAVLWCCRPRYLTLDVRYLTGKGDIVKYIYEKLLQQEDEGQINIKFLMISSSKDEKQFSDLNSLLKALSRQRSNTITFIKEEVVREAG